jgi:hypothetical protein
VLDQDVDQRPQLLVAQPVGDLERQVGLAAVPVVQGELAVEQAAAVAVEAVGEHGDGLAQEGAQVSGVLQRLADGAVGQVARRIARGTHGRIPACCLGCSPSAASTRTIAAA